MSRSAISLAAVTDTMHAHHANDIGNRVNHPVISRSNAPVVLGARELPAAGRTRVARQPLNRRDHPIMSVGGQPAQVFLGGAFQ